MLQSFINQDSLNTIFETLILLNQNNKNNKIIFGCCIQILKNYNIKDLNELFDTSSILLSSLSFDTFKDLDISIEKLIEKVKDIINYFNFNEICYQYYCKEHFLEKYPELSTNEDLWPNVCYAVGRNICSGEDQLKEMVETVIEDLIELDEEEKRINSEN
jgi:hypothetical protein